MAATSTLPGHEKGNSSLLHLYPGSDKPLDKSILTLDEEELAFFKETTGIHDEQELKDHICAVQAEAYKVWPYPCIRNFNFTKLKISRMTGYPQLMHLPKTRPDAIFLDIGCCFGNDARKAVLDGYPMQNVICSDLRAPYWDCGFKLFRDQDTFHVPFIAGDAFEPAFLSPTPVEKTGPRPPLNEVKTLTQLQGQVSAIHASSFFHLFDEEHQSRLAHLTGSLLLKQPGSMIFGSHAGLATPGIRNDRGAYGHSPQSWTELWEEVLGKGKCEVKAELKHHRAKTSADRTDDRELLMFTVTVL